MCFRKTYSSIRKGLRKKLVINKKRKLLINKTPTIISSDCTGGVVYNELGLEFRSPTINMFFSAKDFVRFCSNIKYWVDQPMIEIKSDYPYPLATLGVDGIVLHLVHYKSVKEAQEKWNVRKQRIDYSNLFLIMNDRNWCTYADIEEFDKLTFSNKVCFSHVPHSEIKCVYLVKGFENQVEVPVMTQYINKFSVRKNLDCFSFVDWLNQV